MDIPCVICSTPFPAKRASARYCSERCKKRAQRDPTRPANGTSGTPAPVASIRPATGRTTELTERALVDAGRIDTWLGAVAMALAAKVDDPGLDTGSSVAALARQLQATMEAALDGVNVAATPLERMKAQRERRSA